MERQSLNNLHQPAQKAPNNNECQPSTSRLTVKNYSRPNNFYRETNKNAIRNADKTSRYQNKPRNREFRSISQNIKDTIDSSRNYLNDSRRFLGVTPFQKNFNHGKFLFKEKFVQANCHFLVSTNVDYNEHLKNPDLPINWDLIEEVLFTCDANELCCPICLSIPVAAKITRCGHIYCWSCILHYLALSDKDSRSCPICYETLKKSELKSVSIIKKIDYAESNFLTLTLMKVPKGSIVVTPIKCENANLLTDFHTKDPKLDVFLKFAIISTQELLKLIERERYELNKQLLEYQEEKMPEICFVQNAVDELNERKSKQLGLVQSELIGIFDFGIEDKMPNLDDYIYFYQSEDGQQIYLHSLNIRMLKHEFGDLKNCPTSITAKIVELHRETVSEDMRKRFPHLRHLPLSCEFKFVQLEFDKSVVSQATLDEFQKEINDRKKNRKRKEKAQNIRDRNIEIENNKKIYGIYPSPEYKLDNTADFPSYHLEMDNTEIRISNPDEFPSPLLVEPDSSPTNSPTDFQSSFATMLSNGRSNFNETLHKKSAATSEDKIDFGDMEDSEQVLAQTMNQITLSDFLDNCVKTGKKKKGKKKK